MRHRIAHRKLGRVTEHRIALLRNQASTVIDLGRVQTTVARAKEVRPFVERLITVAKRSLNAPEKSTDNIVARRRVATDLADRDVVRKLFDEVAPRFADRNGGYTRILRLGYRRGDSAEVAVLELIGSEYNPAAAKATDKDGKAADGSTAAPKKKGVGARIREALGGRKKAQDDAAGGKGARVDKAAKGGGRKVTTPRKAGGS